MRRSRLKQKGYETKARLLEVAAQLFAERGFNGAGVREICKQAKINISAINYHFGSKKELYLEVFRTYLIPKTLEIRDNFKNLVSQKPKTLKGVVEALAEAVLLNPIDEKQRKIIFSLIVRELTNDSETSKFVLKKVLNPLLEEFSKAIYPFFSSKQDLKLFAFSVISQIIFFNFFKPWIREVFGTTSYTSEFKQKIIKHIAEFSTCLENFC